METFSGEVTLYDLIAWEPRIHAIAPRTDSPHWRSLATIDVDWVITARSTQPMLPTLRGGELIVLPERIVRLSGLSLSALLRQLAEQPVAGVLTDHLGEIDADIPLAVLHVPSIDAEIERDLNRVVTNGRRQALQRMAELDQAIAEATARGARPAELVDRISRVLGIPVTVHTPGNTVLFTTGTSRDVPIANSEAWVRSVLRNGYTVWLGSVPPAKHAVARFAIPHIRDALQRAMESAPGQAPRGNARVAALNTLLLEPIHTDHEKLSQQAHLAGVPTDRFLRVAYSSASVPETQVRRSLQSLGDVLEAGEWQGHKLWLVVSRAMIPAGGRLAAPSDGWLAVSGVVHNPGELPEASRQARYLSGLLQANLVRQHAIAFDDNAAIGVHSLLYPGWDSADQRAYRDAHLGPLLENDPRGQLVETLGVYLDQQGSQSHAAEKLGIHRNTLSYRLRQIESALPVDLSAPHTRLTLHIAIAIHRMITL